MSVGSNLQEMENVVTKGAAKAEAPHKSATPVATPGQTGAWEDLGGPTPENYKVDDDSAKLKEPSLATVADIVKKGAKPAEPMKKMAEEEAEFEVEEGQEIVSEEEITEDEVVSEEETTEDEVVAEATDETEEYDIEEDVNALLAGEELSEEFQEKARTIFEAALRSKVSQIQENLEEQYAVALAEEVEEIKTELSERVDAYLEYVSDEWMQENALVIEQGLKTEMTESFLQGMKGLFEDHYVSIPEDKYDVLESMVEKLDDMETKLNEQIEKNVSLNKRLAEAVADGIFDQVADGLADTQKDKLASLAESVEFESEVEYREKLETLKESYFPSRVVSPSAKTETLSESTEAIQEPVSDAMAAYLRTLSGFRKN